MNYVEVKPSFKIRNKCLHIWSLKSPGKELSSPCEVIPDACADLVVESVGSSLRLLLFGSSKEKYDFETKLGASYFGLRFLPGVMPLLDDYEVLDLTDSHIDLTDFGMRTGLLENFSNTKGVDQKKEYFEKEAANFIFKEQGVIEKDLLTRSYGAISVNKILESFSYLNKSKRQIERDFKKATGLSPYRFQRIIRFQYAKRLLSFNESKTFVALEAGYFDQSHMINEFKKLSGSKPSDFN